MTTTTTERTEFGWTRTECACRTCRRNCMFMPGFLIPADLPRMIPDGEDPLEWADNNLLASPGAKVWSAERGEFRIGTLVPATKDDGSCIHYRHRRCQIHPVAPFGCAFFDCQPERGELSHLGLIEVMRAWRDETSLYTVIWRRLWSGGKRQDFPENLRRAMAEQ